MKAKPDGLKSTKRVQKNQFSSSFNPMVKSTPWVKLIFKPSKEKLLGFEYFSSEGIS